MRWMRCLPVVACTIALGALPLAPARAAKVPPAFAPGLWSGTMTIEGGIALGDIQGTGNGSGSFSFTVQRSGDVSSGNLSLTETFVTTAPEGTFNSSASGSFPLHGDARSVTGAGTTNFHIDTPFGPVDSPVDGQASLIPLHASCRTATGDIAIPERQFQEAEGIATNVTAEFTAHHRGSGAGGGAGVAHAATVAAQSIQDYVGHPTNSAAASLAGQEVKALSAAVGAASACGGAPPGYERGLLATGSAARSATCSTAWPPTTRCSSPSSSRRSWTRRSRSARRGRSCRRWWPRWRT